MRSNKTMISMEEYGVPYDDLEAMEKRRVDDLSKKERNAEDY